MTEFSTKSRSDGSTRPSAKCYLCESEYSTEYQKTRRHNKNTPKDRIREYLGEILCHSLCTDCGKWDPISFEFDHLDGETKIANVTALTSLEKVKAEVTKCEIVCACCHRHRTAVRANSWRVQLVSEFLKRELGQKLP